MTRTSRELAPGGRNLAPAAGAFRVGLLAAGLLILADVGLAQQASAQGMSPGALAWGNGGCAECHGGVGAGGGGGEAPPGPSLWTTKLDRDLLKETVACGRPATGMPFNVAGAYKTRACWGLPLADPPKEVAPGASLSPADLDTLVEFLFANVVGKGPVTKAKCGAFFGNNPAHPVCAPYRN